jgi:hypothetical protein
MRAKAPEPISGLFYNSKLFNKNDNNLDMNVCPAFNSNMNNVFALRSMYSYEIYLDNNKLYSNDYDQAFFNRHAIPKSLDRRLFSFTQGYTFFTEEDSLEVVFSEYPYLEDNNITDRCLLLPGTMDIGKWYRNTDTMFYLKEKYPSFLIEEDEIYSYIRFDTKEKIKFVQYRQTELLNRYMFDSIKVKENKKRPYPLNKYYSMFKSKSLILKEIKDNILEE